MQEPAIRVLELTGDAVARGGAHGRAYPQEIGHFAAARLELAREGTRLGRDELLTLGERCLPSHEAYAPDLYAEMISLAEAAGVTGAEAVILGGFTDFVDVVRAHAGDPPVSDNCTAVLVPDTAAGGAGYLAQTWDMDASAVEHVVMLRIEPDSGPAALVFSTAGCLGQIGMNEAGLAVGINNLTAADGRVGVTWPFVVRKALQQTDLTSAVQSVLEADLAGGHNYLLFDRHGKGVNIEAMPTAYHSSELNSEPLVHTNHCLVPNTRAVEGPRPSHLQESSDARRADALDFLAHRPVTQASLMALTRDESSICRRPLPPEYYQTCGAVIMRPKSGEMWACWGIPSDSPYEHFQLECVAG